MKTLSNLSIRNKIILMLLFPVAGLLFFSYSGIMDRMNMAEEMNKVEKLSQLTNRISSLVHEIQKERGLTAGFIGSSGNKFDSMLPAQRSQTDKRISDLNVFLDGIDASDMSKTSASQLSAAMGNLNAISNHRQAVSSLSMNTDDAIGYYTDINTKFLDVVAGLTKATTQGDIGRKIAAYYNFLQAKERAGIERAVLTNTFAMDQFGEGMYNKFSALVSAQDAYINSFMALASDEVRDFYHDKMQNNSVSEVEKMRNTAFRKSSDGYFGIEPDYWFEQQTSKINLLKDVEDHIADSLAENANSLKVSAQQSLTFYSVFACIIVALALFLGILITRGTTSALRQTLTAMNDIAEGEGDLTRRLEVNGKDEVAQVANAFNRFADKIHNMVVKIKESTKSINTSSTEIAEGNANLSQRTEEHSSSLEETASSMEQMTTTVKQNADNAKQANQVAAEARDHAEKGGKVVAEAVSAMEDINKSSKEIVDIISVIDEIAFQTNLLALNASVEAARAGEQGRGFSVVADEVRNLAQRSAESAKEIKQLIENSVGKIEQGTELVNQSGNTLDEIVTSVKKVTDIVADISAASQEQSQGIDQVNKAVTQMDEMTQQNASLVEQAAAASKSMDDQCQALNVLMSQFKVDNDVQQIQLPNTPEPASTKVSQQPEPTKSSNHDENTHDNMHAAASARTQPKNSSYDNERWEEF